MRGQRDEAPQSRVEAAFHTTTRPKMNTRLLLFPKVNLNVARAAMAELRAAHPNFEQRR